MEVVKGLSLYVLLNILLLCCYFICISDASDTLVQGQPLRSNQSLLSSGGVFELGFFSFDNKNYLGIWLRYDKYKKAVWIANQEYPMVVRPVLLITEDGDLVLNDARGDPKVVNDGAPAKDGNTIAKLLDTGNLVLLEGNRTVWQSFDDPSDTYLPGMKLGALNFNTGRFRNQFLTSWLSPLDPSPGSFALALELENRTRFDVWRTTNDPAFHVIGYWDGKTFKMFFQTSSEKYNFSFISNPKEAYLTFTNNENGTLSWFELASNGDINEVTVVGKEIKILSHSLCHDTLLRNSSGCLSVMPSLCRDGDRFSKINALLPDSMRVNRSVRIGPSECELICKSNCSCTAYATFNDDNKICDLYYGDKSDLKLSRRGNHSIYIRGDLPTHSSSSGKLSILNK